MLETNLFVLEPDLEVVTNALARMEALHLEDAVPEGWAPSSEWTELANRYSALTTRLSDMLGALRCKPAARFGAGQRLTPDARLARHRRASVGFGNASSILAAAA